MSNPEGLAIARRLIAEEAEKQTGFLDLGMLGLTELPEEIHQLEHLQRLNLDYGFRDEAGKWHRAAHSLGNNNFSDQPLPPLRFPQLKTLGLSRTSVSELSPLAGLSSLQSLHCWQTSVSDLSRLARLSSL